MKTGIGRRAEESALPFVGRRWLAVCLIPLLLAGCSLDLNPLTQAETAHSDKSESADERPIRLVVNGEEKRVQEASLVTPEGKRLDMTRRAYIRSWNELLAEPSQSLSAGDRSSQYPLIWVVRIRGEEPILFRLGKEGAYWRGKRYAGDAADTLYTASMKALATARLDEVTEGVATHFLARDTEQKVDASDSEANEWLSRLSDAQYLSSDPPRVVGLPLYPFYELKVSGPDLPASVWLVDERRFLLRYGKEMHLFAAEDSGYQRAAALLVPRRPPSLDIRFLLEGKLVEVARSQGDKRIPYPSTSTADEAVREWLRKTADCPVDNEALVGKEPFLTLYFQRAETIVPVQVYENGYRLNGGAVIPCADIDRRTRSLVEGG
jgi:hypothetical protein